MSFFTKPTQPVLVIAPFPPSHFAAADQAAELVHGLSSAGIAVQTMSAVAPSYCQKTLHFAPKRRFLPILDAILTENHALTVFFPQALGFGKINQPTWKLRRVEEWRRLKLMAKIAFKKPKLVIAYPTDLSSPAKFSTLLIALAAKICRPFSVRLVNKNQRGIALASKILGDNLPSCEPTEAEATLFKLANADAKMRLTPTWLRNAFEKTAFDDPLKSELRELLKVVDLLAKQPMFFAGETANFTNAGFDDPILNPEADTPVTEYMEHLRHSLKIAHRFTLSTRENRAEFLRWYMLDAPELLQQPLPLPAKVFDAFKADCKSQANLDHVAALRNPDTKDVILPAYFLALHRTRRGRYQRYKLNNNAHRIAFAFHVIADHSRFHIDADFLGKNLCTYFMSPVGDKPDNISRIKLLTAVLAHARVENQDALVRPWLSKPLSTWFAQLCNHGFPMLTGLCRVKLAPSNPKLLVSGANAAETGLGRNQDMSKTALRNLPTNRPVLLHHTNAHDIPSQVLRHHQDGAFHIGYLLWELEKLPKSHQLANKMLDEIWAPSTFVQRIYENAFDRRVTMIGKGFDLPDVAPANLSEYGIDAGQTVFLNCFDMHSSVSRKNPVATAKAFLKAFPLDPSKRLIIKTTPPPKDHWGDPTEQMAKIKKLAANDPRIILDQRMLPFQDLLALVRAAHCTVSSHRAEGFGYFPAYALKYGRPVIATNYSGTTDFCTNATAFPVGFKMKKVKRSEVIFPVENAEWAEVDVSEMAQNMRDVAADMAGALQRGKAGQALMNDYYSRQALAARYLDRLDGLRLLVDANEQSDWIEQAAPSVEPAI